MLTGMVSPPSYRLATVHSTSVGNRAISARFPRGFKHPVDSRAPDAHQVAGSGRIVLDLAPQADDVAVDGAIGDERLPAPGILDQLLGGSAPPRCARTLPGA